MRILIVTPPNIARTGNRCTADQWADHLVALGHDVTVANTYQSQDAQLLIALHGEKSAAAIRDFPGRIVLALTGTDVYPEPAPATLESMRRADLIVALQPRVREQVPAPWRDKLRVIIQSADAVAAGAKTLDPFDVCVVSHLREVKDPLRAAAASRLLPPESKIRIRHAGAILEPRYRELVEAEQRDNRRFRWLGELGPADARRLMATCRLLVASSFFEGGGRVIGEALLAGTPVLAARNDAAAALLGDDYPALFDAGDTQSLADLMHRAETDAAFRQDLHDRMGALARQFDPRRERAAWRELLAELKEAA